MFWIWSSLFSSFFSVDGLRETVRDLQYFMVCPDLPQLRHFWERRVGHVTRPVLSLTQWEEYSCSDLPASRHTLQFGFDILKLVDVWFVTFLYFQKLCSIFFSCRRLTVFKKKMIFFSEIIPKAPKNSSTF